MLLDGVLAHGLTQAGHAPEQLEVTAKVTLDIVDGAPTVTTSELTGQRRGAGHRSGGVRGGRHRGGQELPDLPRARRASQISVTATLAG